MKTELPNSTQKLLDEAKAHVMRTYAETTFLELGDETAAFLLSVEGEYLKYRDR